MTEKASIYEKTYENYMAQVNAQDFTGKEEILGIRIEADDVIIPFFGKDYRVKPDGISDDNGRSPHFAVNVVLLKYLLHFEPGTAQMDQDSQWVSYRDFKDAAPLVNYFSNNTEKAIAQHFSGRAKVLASACMMLGGNVCNEGLSYDLTMQVLSLPRLPLYLLFNDADEEFPTDCSVLFERRAEKYLDMECLAIVGWLFSDFLVRASGGKHTTVI